MHDEKYKDLMLRFAKEMNQVGVTENMIKIVHAQMERAPNLISAQAEDTTRKFTYRYDGYLIEAEQTVSIKVKTCK